MKPYRRLADIFYPLLIAVLIGALAGLGAVFFRWLINTFFSLLQMAGNFFCGVSGEPHWLWRLLLPAMGGLVIGPVIAFWAPEIRGPGVPEVMEALALKGGHIRHRVTLIKTGATAMLIAAGASVGREGPIVQIGASIGSTVIQLLKLDRDKRRMAVACGAAAGIAATFQAPMAGTLFAVEILLLELEAAYLSNIVIAAVTGTLVSRYCWQGAAVFHIPPFVMQQPAELLLYLGMGLACGFFSLFLMAVVFGLPRLYERYNLPVWLTPALGGLVVGCLGLVWPQVLGLGYVTINEALGNNIPLALAAALVLVKILATGFSIGSGMSGGIFAPSLFIGAMTGSVFGHFAQLIWPATINTTAYFSLIGMGAMVSGTTLAPITAIMTIFELTYNYEVILPLMVACIPSLLVVKILHGYSVYETNLLRRGINIVRGHDVNRLRSMVVSNYMCRELQLLTVDTPLCRIGELMEQSSFPHFVVVDLRGELAGVLTLRDLRSRLTRPEQFSDATQAAALMQKEVVTVVEDDDLETAFHLFAGNEFSFLPVVGKGAPRKVVGYLKKSDLVAAYDQQILKERILQPLSWVCPIGKKR
jgi:CIC family chloride channel protein